MCTTTFSTPRTSPVSTYSLNWWYLTVEWPWLPICVTTPYLSAAFIMSSHSSNVCASGFSTYTALPSFIACIAIGKWLWSGTATMTASILSAILSNIFLKSWKRGTSGYFLRQSCVCGAPMSVSHTATHSKRRGNLPNCRMSYQPCWPMPTKAMRTLPLATYPLGEKQPGSSGNAPAAAADFRNWRLFIRAPSASGCSRRPWSRCGPE